MLSALPSTTLAKGAPNNAAFFTTVGAARYFIERRMAGKYRDLMGLIEFGDDAYVITPFTTDYENILLSTALIGDWNEFMAFPDQGTVVARAVEQAVGLVPRLRLSRRLGQPDGDLHRRRRRGRARERQDRGRRAGRSAAGEDSRLPDQDRRQHPEQAQRRRRRCGSARSRKPAASFSRAATKPRSSGRSRRSIAARPARSK